MSAKTTLIVLPGLIACLLIIRGLGLGIPYLSPVADLDNKIISCSAKP